MVPDSAKPSSTTLPPTIPSEPSASSSTGGNGKRSLSINHQQQCTAVPRYPPREVPPRFRQHEHKQLLKRGQPLPAGSTALVQPSSNNPTPQPVCCQNDPVPDSAKPSSTTLPPTIPSEPSASSSTGGNGKRSLSINHQQQCTAVPRYPPREVPPRFRQHEHKQLLKRGQPLPAGSTALVQPSSNNPTPQPVCCQNDPG
ncbi:hypothetical protein DNTS_028798 [Danionella cerebrum]|uniref:Uncharacterized protein n=1 Tax=Danionella cerebrum TaxID=2873325 RepID=A0A553NMT7_9TELE|nr:hypothetical protein DNTS_028798 [Danionella translucida]